MTYKLGFFVKTLSSKDEYDLSMFVDNFRAESTACYMAYRPKSLFTVYLWLEEWKSRHTTKFFGTLEWKTNILWKQELNT